MKKYILLFFLVLTSALTPDSYVYGADLLFDRIVLELTVGDTKVYRGFAVAQERYGEIMLMHQKGHYDGLIRALEGYNFALHAMEENIGLVGEQEREQVRRSVDVQAFNIAQILHDLAYDELFDTRQSQRALLLFEETSEMTNVSEEGQLRLLLKKNRGTLNVSIDRMYVGHNRFSVDESLTLEPGRARTLLYVNVTPGTYDEIELHINDGRTDVNVLRVKKLMLIAPSKVTPVVIELKILPIEGQYQLVPLTPEEMRSLTFCIADNQCPENHACFSGICEPV